MTKREQREAAAILERLAELVDRDKVTAAAGFLGRLQGAAVTLRLLAGGRGTSPNTSTRAG